MAPQLVIANKNYSSWSMRPWVLMRALQIPFDEVMLKFDSAEWAERIGTLSPSKRVPALIDTTGEGTQAIWESVAIIEYLADRFPDAGVWPRERRARAHARCLVAEMHAGFSALRSNMPMNIRASFPGFGMAPGVQGNIARIETIWRETRREYAGGEPFLFGAFSAADAMYAPVVMRFATYQPALANDTLAYCEAVKAAPGVREWIAEALMETEFVAHDEPYA